MDVCLEAYCHLANCLRSILVRAVDLTVMLVMLGSFKKCNWYVLFPQANGFAAVWRSSDDLFQKCFLCQQKMQKGKYKLAGTKTFLNNI